MGKIMYYLLSILLGLIPEVLYFILFLSYTKNLKGKKIKLFVLISVAYFLCILVQQWHTLYYIVLIALIYLILKLLYKNKIQIIDVFIISIMCFWLTLISFILLFVLNKDYSNFIVLSIVARIMLFLPFIFRKKFNLIYKKYCKLWNRNDAEKRKIKSITLRNISLILTNGFILIMNIAMVNMINTLK